MAKNITRRDAAKAVALGAAAAFVAPAALAGDNPDAEILALARELERIETEVIPPLAKAHGEAERAVFDAVPHQAPPRSTLAQIDAEEAKELALLKEPGHNGDVCRLVNAAMRRDVDGETAVKQRHEVRREEVRQYEEWKAARLQVEKDVGLFEKEQRMDAAEGEAEAIREKICTIPARTEAGYLVKLKIAMDGKHPDSITDPEYVTDKALVSLLHDMQAGA